MFPRRLAPLLFGLLLSGMMTLLLSGLGSWRAAGLGPAFITSWLRAWLTAWPIAFSSGLVIAPLARRLVESLVSKS